MATTQERRVYAVAFPTLDEFEQQLIKPLAKAIADVETFAIDLGNICGRVDTEFFEARFAKPPTTADIGALAIFLDELEIDVDHARTLIQDMRAVWHEVVSMSREGYVRFETTPEEIANA